jgi:hypothetical protein
MLKAPLRQRRMLKIGIRRQALLLVGEGYRRTWTMQMCPLKIE